MVKHLFIMLSLIIGISSNVNGQKFESLKKATSSKGLNDSTSIVYGLFIQRLGFSSGGFPQEIRIQNVLTERIYTFNVKPTMKSSKENSFCYYIKPGLYKILSYFWTKSKWYGGELHEEPIFKDIDTSTKDYNKRVQKGMINPNKLESYYIEIRPNTIYYTGTWNFNTGLVTFGDEKEALDNKLKNKDLNFSEAVTKLPE